MRSLSRATEVAMRSYGCTEVLLFAGGRRDFGTDLPTLGQSVRLWARPSDSGTVKIGPKAPRVGRSP